MKPGAYRVKAFPRPGRPKRVAIFALGTDPEGAWRAAIFFYLSLHRQKKRLGALAGWSRDLPAGSYWAPVEARFTGDPAALPPSRPPRPAPPRPRVPYGVRTWNSPTPTLESYDRMVRALAAAGVNCIVVQPGGWQDVADSGAVCRAALDFAWSRGLYTIFYVGNDLVPHRPSPLQLNHKAIVAAIRRHPGLLAWRLYNQLTDKLTAVEQHLVRTQIAWLRRRIIEQMATRYGEHPQLIGWQTDNEISGLPCFCGHCRAAFREWRRRKYGTVEAMNDALGMVFWAREFSDWDEVDLPIPLTKQAHPSLQLEIQRFFSHAWTEYCRRQVELIRRHSPGRFVTHNLPGVGIALDLFEFAAAHDFLSADMYPQPMINHRWMVARCGLVTRSVQSRPHWVMELTTGSPVTQFYKAPVPRPGQLRLWAHQNAAYGAQGVVFFPWRKRPAGYEMLSNGLLEHDGKPRRYYREAQHIGRDFAALADALPAYDAPDEVALVYDFQDRCNAAINPQILDVPFLPYLDQWMRAARRLGLSVRYVRSTDDLSRFSLVIAPNQYTTSDEIAANYKRYVEAGGTLLATQRIGIFNTHGNPVHERMPGKMRDLFGMEIDEYERCMYVNPNRLVFADRDDLRSAGLSVEECRDWVFILALAGAEPLATFEREYYAGKPGASLNEYGRGKALYLGTMLDDAGTQRFLAFAARLAGLSLLPADWPEDVELVRLADDAGRPLLVFLNHALESRAVSLASLFAAGMAPHAAATDLLTGERFDGKIDMPPAGVRWLRAD